MDQSNNNITLGYTSGEFSITHDDSTEKISAVGVADLFLYKRSNVTGGKVWLKTLNAGGRGSIAPSFAEYAGDKIYVFANLENVVEINGVEYGAINQRSTILIQFDNDGNALWGNILSSGYDDYSQMSNLVVLNNSVFALLNNRLIKIDKNTGEYISEKSFEGNIKTLKSYNDNLYFGAYSNVGFNFNKVAVEKGQSYIAKIDDKFNLKNIVTFDTEDLMYKYPSVITFEITEDDKIYFLLGTNTKKSIAGKFDNGEVFSGEVSRNNSSFGSYYWFGSIDSNFTKNDSFFGNYKGSSLNVSLIASVRDHLRFYFSGGSNIDFKDIKISANSQGYIDVDKQGNYLNHFLYDFSYGPSNTGYKKYFFSDLNKDYAVNINGYTSQTIFSKALGINNFSTDAITINSQNLGNISAKLLDQTSDGGFYNFANIRGIISNYLGENINTGDDYMHRVDKLSNTMQRQWTFQFKNMTAEFYKKNEVSDDFLFITKCFENYPITNICQHILDNGDVIDLSKNSSYLTMLDVNGKMKWNGKLSFGYGGGNTLNSVIVRDEFTFVLGVVSGYSNVFYNDLSLGGEENFSTTYLLKLDKQGNIVDRKTYPYFSGESKLFINRNNELVLFSDFVKANNTNKINFDGLEVDYNDLISNYFMLKYNEDLNIISGKNLITENTNFIPSKLNIIKDNNTFIISKLIKDGTVFNGIKYNNPSKFATYYDVNLISKLDENANYIWTTPLYSVDYGVGAVGIKSDENSNVYFFMGGKERKIINTDFNKLGTLLVKLDKNGALSNYKYFGDGISLVSPSVFVKNDDKLVFSSELNLSSKKEIDGHLINTLGGTSYIVAFLEKESLDIVEHNNIDLKVYPNPTKEWLNVKSDERFDFVNVYDVNGRLLMQEKLKTDKINIEFLRKGVYYIEFLGKKNVVKKIIKE